MAAEGTATCQTGKPTVLMPTRAPNVAMRRMLPKIAPDVSMSAVLGRSMPIPLPSPCDSSMLGGMYSAERNSTMKRYRYTVNAAARNGRTTDDVYVTNESENAPDKTKLVGFEEINTADAMALMNVPK